MDFGELKKQSDLSYDIAVAKQNALQKAESRMVIAHEGHLFRADANTICTVKTLMDHSSTFTLLDTNGNPVVINDPQNFLDRLIERNQESLNAYHNTYKTFERK